MFKYAVVSNDYQETKLKVIDLKSKLMKINAIEDTINPEYVFVVGGDGTFIKSINIYQEILKEVIFVPFHAGGIGFYTNHNNAADEKELLNAIKSNDYKLYYYDLLDIEFDNKHIFAVNELKIVNETKPIFTTINIDGKFFETFHGSGLVFSTANGSTGYLKSTGGAVILDNHDIWEMQEIFPVSTNKFRTINSPIVMSKWHVVTLGGEVNKQDLIIDTFSYKVIQEKIHVKIADFKVNVLVLPSYNVRKAEILKDIFVKDKI
ncbi:hypothetical protein [Spiroplasma endosymbiont of Labia minor]|uniref:hypothetical protein n=1 Tax=Spiroplasma endosymbiont of Labia minor TaxID=3066305 RepID=UPI0030CBBAAD